MHPDDLLSLGGIAMRSTWRICIYCFDVFIKLAYIFVLRFL